MAKTKTIKIHTYRDTRFFKNPNLILNSSILFYACTYYYYTYVLVYVYNCVFHCSNF